MKKQNKTKKQKIKKQKKIGGNPTPCSLSNKEKQILEKVVEDKYIDKGELNELLFIIVKTDLVRVLIDLLINKKVDDVNITNKDGVSLLALACLLGHEAIVKILINNNADVNVRNKIGNTPLMAACTIGHVNIVKLLIDNDAIINEENNKGWTAIDFAMDYLMDVVENPNNIKNAELFKLLTRNGGYPGSAFIDKSNKNYLNESRNYRHLGTEPGNECDPVGGKKKQRKTRKRKC